MRVVAIAGSLRPGSTSGRLVEALGATWGDAAELVVWDGLDRLPAYAEHAEDAPGAAVLGLRAALHDADALVLVTPEYNGSVPGALKNAVDWASRPHGAGALAGRPTAVVSHSPSPFGGTWAAQDLRRILSVAGARVVAAGPSVGRSHEKVGSDGLVLDAALADDLAAVLDALGALAGGEVAA